jgi:hypothetical protein
LLISEASTLLFELVLGHELAVMAEQPSSLEFILAFDLNGTEKLLRVKVASMHAYMNSVDTLKISCRPPWTSDTVKRCESCVTRFSLIVRRHHCRYCGSLVCGACSQHEAMIPTLGYNLPQRVCKECRKLLDRYERRLLKALKLSKSCSNAGSYLHTIEAEHFSRDEQKERSGIMKC